MKKISLIILTLIIVIGYNSCERDDLCAETTQTTADLVIETFNETSQEDKKNVIGLRIEGIDDEGNGTGVLTDYNVVNTNTLVLPLRTDVDETRYKLHQNYAINDNGTPDDTSDDMIEGNEDIITIRYVRNDVYVSRACGFKTVFSNVSITNDENDTDQWIGFFQAENVNQTIENEAEAHFKLFH
ncbi:DUF6452 family protein [Flavobacteriaceae bacterium MHTCC 0001]